MSKQFIGNDGAKKNDIDVFVQDQISPFNDFYFIQIIGTPTTLTADTVIDSRFVTVASISNISIGDYVGIFETVSKEERYYFGEVLYIVGLQLELYSPFYFFFSSSGPVISSTMNLNFD